MDINGTPAVVTGGASGLGEATARALAAKGAKVAIFDRDVERGEKVAAELGGVFCEVDVTSDEKVAAAFQKARAAHGQERILVNCAGVANAVKTVGKDKATGELKKYPMHQFELAIGIKVQTAKRAVAGIGQLMVDTLYVRRDVDALVLYMIVIGIVSFLIDSGLRRAQARLMPWTQR